MFSSGSKRKHTMKLSLRVVNERRYISYRARGSDLTYQIRSNSNDKSYLK